jgi:hypothetical protein
VREFTRISAWGESGAKKSAQFYWTLASAVIMTILVGLAAFGLSSRTGLNEHEVEFLILANHAWPIGFGAIVGYLGGNLLDHKSG